MWKKIGGVVAVTAFLLLAAGCGGTSGKSIGDKSIEGSPGTAYKVSTDPVTLKMYLNLGLNEQDLNRFYVEPLKKKFPNLTLEIAKDKIDNLIAAGDVPDLALVSPSGVQRFQQYGYGVDMTPFVKKFGDDLSRFDPVTLESLKMFSDKGELIGMPVLMNFAALFYNKDIFDKFGVPYPKDGMTWDDAIAIGKRLTRTEGDVRYRGLNPAGADLMGYGLSLPYVDLKTNKGLLETDQWKMVLNKASEIYSQPGWLDSKLPDGQGQNDFTISRDTAMLGAWTILSGLEDLQKKGQGMNWDMVTLPNFKEKLGYSREVDFHILMVNKTSKHQDQAFQLISSLTSPEVQEIINRSGSLPVIKKTAEHQKTFASDLEVIKGKNLNAVFGVKANPLHQFTPYDSEARKYLVSAAYDVGASKMDVNTALRAAEDKINKFIDTDLSAKK